MSNLNLEVNGQAVQLQVEPHRLLVEAAARAARA